MVYLIWIPAISRTGWSPWAPRVAVLRSWTARRAGDPHQGKWQYIVGVVESSSMSWEAARISIQALHQAGQLEACNQSFLICMAHTWQLGHACIIILWHPRITARALLLCLLATARAVYVFVEQPAGSIMTAFPYMVWMQNIISRYVIRWQNQF